jgi:hypothetical protein
LIGVAASRDEADAWIECYRAVWRGRMERLDAHLRQLERRR